MLVVRRGYGRIFHTKSIAYWHFDSHAFDKLNYILCNQIQLGFYILWTVKEKELRMASYDGIRL